MPRFTPFYIPALQNRKRVYISGPMTGLPELNAPAFNQAAAKLRRLDYAVCSPTETSGFLGEHLAHHEYLRFDFERVLEADFLVVLPGWEKSKGARAEILMALRMGVKCWDWHTWGKYNLITEDAVADAITGACLDRNAKGYSVLREDAEVKSLHEKIDSILSEPHYKIGGTA